MSISPFDHPVLSGLFGQTDMAAQFSWQQDHETMVQFEEGLARALAAEKIIPDEAAEAISEALTGFSADVASLRQAIGRDGVVVPEFVRQLRAAVGEPYGQHVHFAATSQDVIDTSLVLRLRNALSALDDELTRVIGLLFDLEEKFGQRPLMAVTRMQNALPITVGDRLQSWRAPLVRHAERLEEMAPRLFVLQFGGAVGTLDKLGDKGPAVAQRLADALGLGLPDHSWHNQRDRFAEIAGWLSMVTGNLGKIGQDITLMAQNAVGTIELSGGGGSSAMPHKHNPVGAELLVTLARFNAVQLAGMHQAQIHENERSGAAWTLEWMILPQMVLATGAALDRAGTLLEQVTSMGGDRQV